MQISLKKWAERLDPPPHANTLRNWVRDGKIIPVPRKLGRAYYVHQDAKHIAELGGLSCRLGRAQK
jgi:predicted site-specific integrase-resolvase